MVCIRAASVFVCVRAKPTHCVCLQRKILSSQYCLHTACFTAYIATQMPQCTQTVREYKVSTGILAISSKAALLVKVDTQRPYNAHSVVTMAASAMHLLTLVESSVPASVYIYIALMDL